LLLEKAKPIDSNGVDSCNSKENMEVNQYINLALNNSSSFQNIDDYSKVKKPSNIFLALIKLFGLKIISGIARIRLLLLDLKNFYLQKKSSFPYTRKQLNFAGFVASILFLTWRVTHFLNSLVTEISFSTFLKLLEVAPERIKDLSVTAETFRFNIDGIHNAVSRIVKIEEPIMSRFYHCLESFSIQWIECFAGFWHQVWSSPLQPTTLVSYQSWDLYSTLSSCGRSPVA